MNIKYFSLIFSIIGIIILFFISTLSEPMNIKLCEISKYESKNIKTQGIVIDHYQTKFGSQIIKIRQDNTTVTIFLEDKITVDYGDKISVTGIVQKYNNEWEIIVENKNFLEIIQKWDNISLPIEQVTKNPDRYKNLKIKITAYIDSIFSNYFYISDIEGKNRLLVNYDLHNINKSYSGEKILVKGVLSYNPDESRYELFPLDDQFISLFSNG